ncbi:1-aminocyclopropane-1-carboxylate deaminase/D-cysteine desulfhydrase [Nitrosophilus alvini]|uniref:1-aminocyclopropane-1-carboxylate deaminase/D-cysteine desulfhydrase n=1 Tax=Nitrosophilus alvini TaxID=2714855 RepID=UPI00190B4C4D|nr:1-aminocyclopropane-1-carboxylate deaminase/D-cysteine desulfhydrase [Nitrosophilus alvini]
MLLTEIDNSPVHEALFEGRPFFIKRDDLIHPHFSGNKARKFHFFLKNDFPNIKKVVSFGSMQSNAMYSLSVLAKMKGWKFEYYARINKKLLENPTGNLKAALENGMKLIDIKEWRFDAGDINLLSEIKIIGDSLIIPEGGRCQEAEYGIKILAKEIIEWAKEKNIEKLNIFLPSGTGTTALYLKKNLCDIHYPVFNVYTAACVGDGKYLKEQFFSLEEERYHPAIVEPPKKYRYAGLYRELYEIWYELKNETGIEFDLLYDPVGWKALLNSSLLTCDLPLLYIHQGGLKGNESMRQRYEEKFGKIALKREKGMR